MPKVSILVPIYNVEKYLRECLESLVNQTLIDIEIICLNDGSTDNSLSIIEEYAQKDARVKVINKKNSGYGASMNVGLANSTGEYIGIVESDDFASHNMFEELYNLAKESDCDMVKSDYYDYFSNPKRIIKHGKMAKYKLNKIVSAKDDFQILRIIPSIWSGLYKKEFLTKNNIKFLESSGASFQDTSFSKITLMMAQKLILTSNAYLYYRNDNVNSSVKSSEKVYNICDEYKAIHEYINNHKELEIFRSTIYAKQFEDYCWNFFRLEDKKAKEFFKYFYKEFRTYNDKEMLSSDFYKELKKRYNFNLFIKKPEKYYKNLIKKSSKNKLKEIHRKLFSIRINSQRVSIILFGKQIVRIG